MGASVCATSATGLGQHGPALVLRHVVLRCGAIAFRLYPRGAPARDMPPPGAATWLRRRPPPPRGRRGWRRCPKAIRLAGVVEVLRSAQSPSSPAIAPTVRRRRRPLDLLGELGAHRRRAGERGPRPPPRSAAVRHVLRHRPRLSTALMPRNRRRSAAWSPPRAQPRCPCPSSP